MPSQPQHHGGTQGSVSLTRFRFWAQPHFSKRKVTKVILFKEEIHLTWKTLSLQAQIKLLMLALKIGYTHLCSPATLACDSSIQNCIFHGRWPEYFCLFFWINSQCWPGHLWLHERQEPPQAVPMDSRTGTEPTLLPALTPHTTSTSQGAEITTEATTTVNMLF